MAAPRLSLGAPPQLERAMVARQRLVVASHPRQRLAKVVQRVGEVARHIRLFADFQRPLEVGLRFGEVALGEVDVANVVQHERLGGAIAEVAPQLERLAQSGSASSGRPSVSL